MNIRIVLIAIAMIYSSVSMMKTNTICILERSPLILLYNPAPVQSYLPMYLRAPRSFQHNRIEDDVFLLAFQILML